MEEAGEPDAPRLVERLRGLRRLLEARQRHLQAHIAACEELAAELAGLQAALSAGCPSTPCESTPADRRSLPADEEDAKP